MVRKFNAKIKVAGKAHIKKDKEAGQAFKKISLSSAKTSSSLRKKSTKKINLYCQVASRFGLFTRTGKGLTALWRSLGYFFLFSAFRAPDLKFNF